MHIDLFCASRLGACVALAASLGQPARAEPLLEQPLEDLLSVRLTTLGRQVRPEQDMAIATSVFSGEDLRRGGARTVLEALAWMPGVWLERFDARTATVGARGDGSSLIARNLLILRDGREQESAGGTQAWSYLNLPLERVQRIEVQRGAGNALWGSHAANAVINIVTRDIEDGAAGSIDADRGGRASALVQWGSGAATTWGRSLWAGSEHVDGSDRFAGRDDWDALTAHLAGARARVRGDHGAEAVFDLNLFDGTGGSGVGPSGRGVRRETRFSQHEWSARLAVPQPDNAQWQVSGFLQTVHSETDAQADSDTKIGKLALQRNWQGGVHDLIAGASLQSNVTAAGGQGANAQRVDEAQVLQAYAQDEWHFAERRVALVAGAQVQRFFSDASVVNVTSSALRLRATASPRLSVWAALSRSETPLVQGTGIVAIPAVEGGLRWQPGPRLQLNAAAFEQRISGLHLASQPSPGRAQTTATLDIDLKVHGAEADLRWQATARWSIDAGLSLVRASFSNLRTTTALPPDEGRYLGAFPRNAFKVRAVYQANERQSFEAGLRARSQLPVGASAGRGIVDLAYRQRLPGRTEFGAALKQANHDTLAGFAAPNTTYPYLERRTAALWIAWGL